MTTEGAENAFESVEAIVKYHNALDLATLQVPRQRGKSDFRLIGRQTDWQQSPRGRAVLAEVSRLPFVDSVHLSGRHVDLRLTDDYLVRVGSDLESGDSFLLDASDLARGRRYVVDYCDPNATKALHVGHLRTIALGNSISALMRHAGGHVTTQSQVADIGRSMGEALAGYKSFADGCTPRTAGLKSDHFVGDCYVRYVRSVRRTDEATGVDAALSNEDVVAGDLADKLLSDWLAHEPEIRALWLKVRSWAVEGQNATLTLLGAGVDRTLFESDYIAEFGHLLSDAKAAGAIIEGSHGGWLFETKRREYPVLVLTRSDGLSTQNLRYMALWHATRQLLAGATSIELLGDEWQPLATGSERLLRAVYPCDELHPTICVVHGMVKSGTSTVKSSRGATVFIDELFRELAGDQRVLELQAYGEGRTLNEIVASILLGYFLSAPARRTFSYDRDEILDSRRNPGWTITQALALCQAFARDCATAPLTRHEDYRYLIAACHLHRHFVREALASHDPFVLIRHYAHLSTWIQGRRTTMPLARAACTLLLAALIACGLAVGRPVVST
jgi:arginyl-tRNA synthetase